MSFNDAGAVQLPLSTWGGLCTEMPPINVPEGASPDCQDVQFRPGAVASRPGLLKQFASAFGTVTVTYAKTYIDPLGVIRNLYLDSAGNIWVEDVTNSAGTVTLLGVTTPGSYAKSITAFGREYIAISDGLHGSEVPLQYDGTNLDRVTQDGPGSTPNIANLNYGSAPLTGSIIRSGNTVTGTTSVPHNLQVGYQVQISKQDAADLGGVTSIVIDNANNPGIATVVYAGIVGLIPGIKIGMSGVNNTVVGGVITNISRQGQVVTCETSLPHGLATGAFVTVDLVTDSTFNASFVITVINAHAFSYAQADADAISSGGVVRLNWPLPTTTPTTFEVLSVLNNTTFTIAINYSDGSWTGGEVTQSWDGTFFVTSVPSATTFTYLDNGVTCASSITVGALATPYGQASPGEHQMQVLFLTRQGYITAPSPPVKFIANGGQYLNVTNIPIGPSNVVARILAFTGAQGAYFFYIPVPAQVNGQVVSTATQINDNSSTNVILDFSDNTLFAAIGINTPGNNLPAQIVIEGALGFGFFGSRLLTYGQRNRIQNFLNLGFDGGHLPSTPTIPTGWLAAGGGAGGALATGHYGQGWHITGAGSIYQGAYEDAYGAPILTPNTKYRLRGWVKNVGGTATVTISSATSGFTTSATLTGATAAGAFIEAAFNAQMPATIPTDMILSLSGTGGALIDELSIIYTDTPYLDRILYGSYVNNPEAFDGVSGKFGPSQDTRKVMDFGMIRATLYLLTQDPSGRLHSVVDNGVTGPAGWTINQVAASCGLLSAFALTKSQADDQTGGGGEEWLAWASASGARIFGGDQPWKISQEIQPDWNAINPAAFKTIWAVNNPTGRVIYFGLPMATATAPNLVYPMDYKDLDTAYEIAMNGPVHQGQNGKLVARDHSRKWTRWNLSINAAALTYRNSTGPLYLTFLYGNGAFPNTVSGGCGNVYILCPGKLTDDCFGQIYPYYTTYFFTVPELEAAMQLGGQRKMLSYFQYDVTGQGIMQVTALVNRLDNPWPLATQRNLRSDPTFSDEWPGGSVVGQRMAFKFESLPGSLS